MRRESVVDGEVVAASPVERVCERDGAISDCIANVIEYEYDYCQNVRLQRGVRLRKTFTQSSYELDYFENERNQTSTITLKSNHDYNHVSLPVQVAVYCALSSKCYAAIVQWSIF